MDLVILEKIGPSILNGLGYIVRLEKKNGNKSTVDFGRFIRKSAAVAAREFAKQTGFSLVPPSWVTDANASVIFEIS